MLAERLLGRMSLSVKIALGAAIVGSVPLIVTGFIIDRANSAAVVSSVNRNHDVALEQASTAIAKSIESIFAELQLLSSSPVLRTEDATDEQLRAELQRFFEPIRLTSASDQVLAESTLRPFEELAVLDRQGSVDVAAGDQFSEVWEQSTWFASAKLGVVSHSAPHFLSANEKLVISIAVPVFTVDGRLLRLVGALVDTNRVLSLAELEGLAVGEVIDLRLIDSSGSYLAGVPRSQLLNSAPLTVSVGGDQMVTRFNDGALAVVGGQRSVGGGTILADDGWHLFSVEKSSDAYAAINSARRDLVIGLFTGFALIVALSLLIARLLTDPLLRITQVVTEFGNGNYHVRLQPRSSDDLGRLARTFNSMADSLQQTHDELIEANRAKNEFLSSLSHELKTPLAAILGFASILSNNSKSNLSQEEHKKLDVINRNGRRLDSLIEDLLDLSKIESKQISLELEMVSVNEVTAEVSASLEPILDAKRQSFISDIRHDPVWISADRGRLVQVLSNLISNASKYSPSDTDIAVRCETQLDHLIISITDEGPGISKSDQVRLFDLFFRTQDAERSAKPGTGIGLYICKKIVELHGGEISVQSTPGSGTTFVVHLPGISFVSPRVDIGQKFKNTFDRLDAAG